MRPVAVVVRILYPSDEALAVDNARRTRVRRIQIRMRIDSAVDHGDADSGPVQSAVPTVGRVDSGGAVVQGPNHRAVKRDIRHVRLIRECKDVPRLHGSRHGVNQRVDHVHDTVEEIDRGADEPSQKPAAGTGLRWAAVLHDYVHSVRRIREQRQQVWRDLRGIRERGPGGEQNEPENGQSGELSAVSREEGLHRP